MVVSLWLVTPIAAMSEAEMEALARAYLQVASVVPDFFRIMFHPA